MAKSRDEFQTVTLKPLLGALDTRSSPEDVLPGVWRWKQNWRMNGGTKLCIRPGHEKAFSEKDPFTNYDLHDQGFPSDTSPAQELPTLIFPAQKNDGSHYLYVGTKSRLFWLNETNGLWNNIGFGISNDGASRFKAAELQEFIVFTNNVNDILSHQTATTTPASTIPDLLSLNISTAGVVAEFAGFMLIMDLVQDGDRTSSRIWWSDFNLPLNWGIVAGSLSNFQDLDYGDQILAAVPMAGALYIFTTQAIWRCTPSGSANVFSFVKVYSDPRARSRCLAYPNALVAIGNACYYLASDGIYYFDPYIPEPELTEWLYRGTSLLLDDASALGPDCCQAAVMGVMPGEKDKPENLEIYVSFPEKSANPDDTCLNSKTLVINPKFQSVDILDHGYGTFGNYIPSIPDDASCKTGTPMFLGSSASDLCLKNIGVNFSREQCTNVGIHGSVVEGEYIPATGAYTFLGYYRILRMMLPLQNFDRDKVINKLLLEVHPTYGVTDNIIRLRMGYSFSEADANSPDVKCAVLWRPAEDRPLICLDTMKPSEYVAQNLIRNDGTDWELYVQGRFLYVDFTFANKDGTAAIGGDCCLSRIEAQIRLCPRPL